MQQFCCIVEPMATTRVDPRIEHTRRVVLEAAVEVIADRGFNGATIDAIAQRCGVARSTIYRHWPERMELLLEAVTARVGPVDTLVTGDLREDLVSLVLHLGDLLGSEPIGSVAAALILESRRDPALDAVRTRFVTERRQAAARVIEEGVVNGRVKKGVQPETLADDLGAPVFFNALIMHSPIDRKWAEAHVDRWLDRYGAKS